MNQTTRPYIREWKAMSRIERHPLVPEHIIEALDRYVKERIPPGGFLHSVLENDLAVACMTADQNNQQLLVPIVRYVWTELPPQCFGDTGTVKEWLKDWADR